MEAFCINFFSFSFFLFFVWYLSHAIAPFLIKCVLRKASGVNLADPFNGRPGGGCPNRGGVIRGFAHGILLASI